MEKQDLVAAEERPTPTLRFKGYRNDWMGAITRFSVILSTVFFMAIMLILTLDYYGVFSRLSSRQNEYMLFVDHQTLSTVFIAAWHIVTLWFLILKVK